MLQVPTKRIMWSIMSSTTTTEAGKAAGRVRMGQRECFVVSPIFNR